MHNLWLFLQTDAGKVALTIGSILFSAFLAIILFLLNRKSKQLTYQIIARTRLLTVKEELEGKVKITYLGEPVSDVGLLQLKIINSGTEPIRADDFVRPITFVALDGTGIMDADIVKTQPENLQAELQKEWASVKLAPLLLNARDWVQIKLLIVNFDGKFAIDSRIDGVELRPGRKKGAFKEGLIETSVIVTVGTTITAAFGAPHRPWIVIIGLFMLSGILTTFARSLTGSLEAPNDYK